MPPSQADASASDRVKVLVMAPHLGSDLSYVASVDPRVEVLDGNAAFTTELAERGLGRGHPLSRPPSRAERDELFGQAEVLLVGYPVLADLAARARSLRWAHHTQAGVSNLFGTDLWTSQVLLTSSRGAVATTAIAEYAIAGVLFFARGLLVPARRTADAGSRPGDYTMSTVSGATLGVVGLGGIGSEVARLARGLGMRVIATRRSVTEAKEHAEGVDLLLPASALLEMAAASDFLVLCSQLTAETAHLIDARVFAAMKAGSVFVNVARGEEVDEDALLDAVGSGHLGGALLDVYDGESAGRPPRQELLGAPTILFTPHVSGLGDSSGGAAVRALFADNLRRYLHGEPMRNVVDRGRGY